jgi:hypothetical protein
MYTAYTVTVQLLIGVPYLVNGSVITGIVTGSE